MLYVWLCQLCSADSYTGEIKEAISSSAEGLRVQRGSKKQDFNQQCRRGGGGGGGSSTHNRTFHFDGFLSASYPLDPGLCSSLLSAVVVKTTTPIIPRCFTTSSRSGYCFDWEMSLISLYCNKCNIWAAVMLPEVVGCILTRTCAMQKLLIIFIYILMCVVIILTMDYIQK